MARKYNDLSFRIIHIVENLDKGAVENWLVNIFLESKKRQPDWEWTFYCIFGEKGRLDEKVIAAGGKIIYSPYWISKKYHFLKYLRQTLRNGRYDIIHSHHDYLSGFYLLATAGLSFKKRILHIHNTDKSLPVGNRRLQKILLGFFHKTAIHFSDLIIGISNDTLNEFIPNKPGSKKTTVLYYGIDLSPFAGSRGKQWFKEELTIPSEAKIILFIGRLSELKNPVFVIDILKEILSAREEVYAVFVGKGDKEEEVLKKAVAYKIPDKVRMTGWRSDGPDIMKASDVLVFPRIEYPKEGLGLVVVEAQAAGTPMVLSRGVVEDAIEIRELVHIIPLDNNVDEWASCVNRLLDQQPAIGQELAYKRMQESKFSLANGTTKLMELYSEA